MAEEQIYKSENIEITSKIARFDTTTYQVSNIGSVAVYVSRKLSPVVIGMFVVAIGLFVWGAQLPPLYKDQAALLIIAAVALIVGSIVVQMMWPLFKSTLVLKTSSNDIHKIELGDVEQMNAIRGAVEEAFVRRA